MWEFSILSSQSICISKTVLKIKSIKKKTIYKSEFASKQWMESMWGTDADKIDRKLIILNWVMIT